MGSRVLFLQEMPIKNVSFLWYTYKKCTFMQRITSDHGVLHYSKVLFLRHISSLIKGTFCGYYSGHFSRKMLVLFKDSKVQCIVSKKNQCCQLWIFSVKTKIHFGKREKKLIGVFYFFLGRKKISLSYFGLLMLEEILKISSNLTQEI